MSTEIGRDETKAETECIDMQLDNIFDTFDEMLLAGNYQGVDTLLDSYYRMEKAFETEVLLGVLVITLPAKIGLKNRDKVYRIVEQRIKDNKQDLSLLDGL